MWCVDNGFPIAAPAKTDALGNHCHLADRGCIIQELAVIDRNVKCNAPHMLAGISAAFGIRYNLTGFCPAFSIKRILIFFTSESLCDNQIDSLFLAFL